MRPGQPQAEDALSAVLQEKIRILRSGVREFGSAVVAFSAGVDSTFLASIAAAELGNRALAVTATSPAFPERELCEAKELAAELGIAHRIIRSNELANPNYANNPASRCYHCKNELYGLMRSLADAEGYAEVMDGMNRDDDADHRPGKHAAQEHRVRSPLRDACFSKLDVRQASRALGLKTADKPAFACLASRFPYGISITEEALRRVEAAENGLRDLGFGQLRVRVHGDLVRIELNPEEIEQAMNPDCRNRIVECLKKCGYRYVTLDLQGYRQGSLNEVFKRIEMGIDRRR